MSECVQKKIFILRRETYYFTIYCDMWITTCNGRSEDFSLMESLMGISLKENWQISVAAIKPFSEQETKKLIAYEKAN